VVTLVLTLLDVVLSVLAVVLASWALVTAEDAQRHERHLAEKIRFLERRIRR
jgi:hypothetical protein